MTAILGISAFYHDSSGGNWSSIGENHLPQRREERFHSQETRRRLSVKRDFNIALSEAGITVEQLDYVGFLRQALLEV